MAEFSRDGDRRRSRPLSFGQPDLGPFQLSQSLLPFLLQGGGNQAIVRIDGVVLPLGTSRLILQVNHLFLQVVFELALMGGLSSADAL